MEGKFQWLSLYFLVVNHLTINILQQKEEEEEDWNRSSFYCHDHKSNLKLNEI